MENYTLQRQTATELLKHDFFKKCGDIKDLKEELIDAMKEYDTYDGDIEYYDGDEKYGSVIYSDTAGTAENLGTLNIIQGDAAVNALTNEPLTSVQSVGSDDGDDASLQQQQQGGTGTQDKLSPNNVPRTSLNVSSVSSQSSATGNSTNTKLKKGQYSQSSRHIMVGNASIGGAIGGPRHSRQFSKRKSTAQAAAIRAHRKLLKQKSYNMSIEWTYSTRASLNMLQVPPIGSDGMSQVNTVDLYDDNSPSTNTPDPKRNRKIKSKSIGNHPSKSASPPDDVLSESDDDPFDGGTMVRGHEARNISLVTFCCFVVLLFCCFLVALLMVALLNWLFLLSLC